VAQADSGPVVSLRAESQALLQRGLDTREPRLVLAAAQLMITSELGQHGRHGVTEPDSAARAAAGDSSAISVADLLRLASQLAVEANDAPTARAAALLARRTEFGLGEPKLVLELENRAKALSSDRGASGGPIWREGFLGANGQIEYGLTFEGGRVLNSITVGASNSHGNLVCSLIRAGQSIAENDGPGSGCRIRWDQKTTNAVTLRIRNVGAETYFVLTSN
jgi:hypothetical protein